MSGDLYELAEALDAIGSALDEGRRPKVGHLRVVYWAAQAHFDRVKAEAASWEPPTDERPHHAALADGTVLRHRTARLDTAAVAAAKRAWWDQEEQEPDLDEDPIGVWERCLAAAVNAALVTEQLAKGRRAGGGDEARWGPPPDPDDLLARLDCGCDPDQGHTCQRRC